MIGNFLQRTFSSFYRVLNYVRLICGSVPRGWVGARWFILTLHYLLVATAFCLLAYFSDDLFPTETIRSSSPLIRRFWAAWIFLLVYLAIRLTIWLLGVLRGGNESEWPKIEDAWTEVQGALDRDGLDLATIPLVVVTGLKPDEESGFFAASGIPWKTVAPDPEAPAPMRVYANHDGIFLSCAGVSAMSAQAEEATRNAGRGASLAATGLSGGGSGGGTATMMPGQLAGAVAAPEAPAATPEPAAIAAGGTVDPATMRAASASASASATAAVGDVAANGPGSGDTATAASLQSNLNSGGTLRSVAGFLQRTLLPGALGASLFGGKSSEAGRATEASVLSGTQRDRYASQMRFVGELLRRERPHCPCNALLEVVPIKWTDYPRQWKSLAKSGRVDREALSETTLLTVPTIVGFSGLETLPSFATVIDRFKPLGAQLLQSRAGVRLPGCNELAEKDARFVARQVVDWFRGWIYNVFAADLAHDRNADVYRFLCELDARRSGLEHLLRSLYPPAKGDEPRSSGRLFGAYAFSSGRTIDTRAFVFGLLSKALQQQNAVLVPDAVIRKDRRMRKVAVALLAASALLLLLGLWIGWETVQEDRVRQDQRAEVSVGRAGLVALSGFGRNDG